MTTSPHSNLPPESVSDKVDLDELFKDAEPYGHGSDWEIPGFFATEAEHQEFLAWYRAERQKDLA